MPNNINTTMSDEGYQGAYRKVFSNQNKKKAKHKINYPFSRKKHPVEGDVAPIKTTPAGRNIYQNGNKYNIAQEVSDNERHARMNETLAKIGAGYLNIEDPYLDGSYQNGRKRK